MINRLVLMGGMCVGVATAAVAGGIEDYPTGMVSDVSALWQNVTPSDDGKWLGPAPGLKHPFNGRNLDGWLFKGTGAHGWTVGTAAIDPDNPKRMVAEKGGSDLINLAGGHGKSLNIYSKSVYGDARITLDVMVPQKSNSGIYLQGEYEVQVLDSFGKDKLGMGDMGAIYSASVPKLNASRKPGKWQSYEIVYRAPVFDASGKKLRNARVEKVILNGQLVQENVEIKGSTGGGVTRQEHARGPLMFQGNHGSVAYRNIVIESLPVE